MIFWKAEMVLREFHEWLRIFGDVANIPEKNLIRSVVVTVPSLSR